MRVVTCNSTEPCGLASKISLSFLNLRICAHTVSVLYLILFVFDL